MDLEHIATAFSQIAQNVYRDDPLWLGEDPNAVLAQLQSASDNPDIKFWTRSIDDKARLAVFMSPKQMVDGRLCAFFGFWESVDSPEDNQALFSEAEAWAREQGAACLIGPINISTFYAYRIRLNTFESGAFPGEPYNPPYYAKLLQNSGFSELKRFHSWLGSSVDRAKDLNQAMTPVVKGLEAAGIRFSNLTGDIWLERLDEFYDYVDQIFGNNYAYTGVSRERFVSGFGQPFAQRLCPECSVLAEDKNGKIAGFFIAFPDYGPLAQQGNPQRKSVSELTYADVTSLPSPRTVMGKTGGVHPDFRQHGLFGAMSYLMMDYACDRYEWVGAVMVREDNPSAKVGQFFFPRPDDQCRDYALFTKDLNKEN